MMKLLIYWASYAYFLAAPLLALAIWRATTWRMRGASALILAALTVLAYARFVEPRLLTVEHAEIDLSNGAAETRDVKIALIGDTHYGIFGNAMPMDRIVAKVRAQGAEALFIAGDLSYHPRPKQMDEALAPLAELDIPVYAVLGNHDWGFPGPNVSGDIFAALQRIGVTTLENRAVEAEFGGARVVLSGASDLWARAFDFEFKADLPEGVPVMMLVHNPDMAAYVPDGFAYDLMLAGHTHGGQIRLPFLYKNAIPTEWPFDKGLHTFPAAAGDRQVYVTPGTGMVGLPMRFLMAPQIDMITLTLPAPGPGASPSLQFAED